MSTHYDPLREFSRLFNTNVRTPASTAMPMDLFRTKAEFVARIDLPGVDPDSIDIDVEDRTLTIRAERTPADQAEEIEWLTRERSVGTYARQLSLGNGVAIDRITADYSDGVLTVTLPVAEEAKPRKVSVTRSGSDRQITGEVAQDEGNAAEEAKQETAE